MFGWDCNWSGWMPPVNNVTIIMVDADIEDFQCQHHYWATIWLMCWVDEIDDMSLDWLQVWTPLVFLIKFSPLRVSSDRIFNIISHIVPWRSPSPISTTFDFSVLFERSSSLLSIQFSLKNATSSCASSPSIPHFISPSLVCHVTHRVSPSPSEGHLISTSCFEGFFLPSDWILRSLISVSCFDNKH